MAVILSHSAAVVVLRARPPAVPLAMIAMTKSIHGCLYFPFRVWCSAIISNMFADVTCYVIVIVKFFRLASSPFQGYFFLFALQCNPMWMRANFELKLQNSPKLPHIHSKFHSNVNEPSSNVKRGTTPPV